MFAFGFLVGLLGGIVLSVLLLTLAFVPGGSNE